MNIYDYLEAKLIKLEEKIGKILLEGDAYFIEWEAIIKLFREIDKFLDFLKEKEVED